MKIPPPPPPQKKEVTIEEVKNEDGIVTGYRVLSKDSPPQVLADGFKTFDAALIWVVEQGYTHAPQP